MSIPILDSPLVAMANATWDEPFIFCTGTEHNPDAFAATDEFEIALKRRGSSDAATRLTTQAGTVLADRPAGQVGANWAAPADQADRIGPWDFQIRRFGIGGEIETLLLGVVDFRPGL